MSDDLRARYDAIPYRHGVVPHTHPARIGAIARIFGIAAAAPDRCRVLELGCGEGMNLLPLAERLPRADFTGIDLSANQIATAERARAACGIANARFVCADLREFEPEAGAFDYVVAHGVYSWVPAEVKERVLAICARALAPAGVAFVSYNVLPGWGLLSGLRRFLLAETASHTDSREKLERARRVIEVMSKCVADQPGAYAGMLREAFADMAAKKPEFFFHDELATVNEPVTFGEFVAHAARHGLEFLSEAHFASMPFEHVPESVRAELAALGPDFLQAQQFMDVLYQRWLRSTLLCRTAPSRVPKPEAIRECAIGLRLAPTSPMMNVEPGAPMQMADGRQLTLTFNTAESKTFLIALAEAAPARIAFAEAVRLGNSLLRQARIYKDADESALLAETCGLFARDAVDLVLTGDGEWLGTSAAASPSALMRWQARENFPLANRWHELVDLTVEGRRALADATQTPSAAALRLAGLSV